MDDVTAARIARAYGLGEVRGHPRAVPGAFSHRVWRLTTAKGRWAVKVFDRSVDHARSPRWPEMMDEAVAIEIAAGRAGLTLPRPVFTGGAAIAEIDGLCVRVHEWAEGAPVPQATRDPLLASRIGVHLATLHRLPLACDPDAAPMVATHDDAHLAALAGRARGRSWAGLMPDARRAWRVVRELAAERATVNRPVIATHRDLGPKNALTAAGGFPVIVDWDVAGPWTADEELAAACLEWSGVKAGEPGRAAARALLEAYAAAGGKGRVSGAETLAAWLVKHANWTEMHLRHALDEHAARRDLAEEAVPGLLGDLVRYAQGVERWAGWLGV
ncbi:membrane protein [Actinorhabdospora filicis]|uniref:Membrane protein n=1 Tax=Actinorhabdospora filicis TaxID=1785913 RepID=A0A9W6SMA0_9ACTN|nr:phosphotransferase [Actinorhabdospora filicis]GLZ78843.1 membrane protein [Actinorhabdospora filicis]